MNWLHLYLDLKRIADSVECHNDPIYEAIANAMDEVWYNLTRLEREALDEME